MELTRDSWTKDSYGEFVKYLQSLSDKKYKEFSDGLVPDAEFSFGVRVPILRSAAKEIVKGNYEEFLNCKIGAYREEIMMQGLVMASVKCGYPQMLSYMKRYAKMIKSWETCDIVSFKGVKKHIAEFWNDVEYFIHSDNPWEVRFGFLHLMGFYLADEYIDGVLAYVNEIDSDFYYVQMMQAWLVATAAAKQRDKTFAFLENNCLNAKTQNMAIQKMRDSYRISPEDKELAKNLKK